MYIAVQPTEVEGQIHLGNMQPSTRAELLEFAELFKNKIESFQVRYLIHVVDDGNDTLSRERERF
jgi:hypothetical protein